MPSHVSNLIAARSGTRHLDLIAKADDAGEAADRALSRAWSALLAILDAKPRPLLFVLRAQLAPVIRQIYLAAHAELGKRLERLAIQGHNDAAQVLAKTLPIESLASRVRLREDKEPTPRPGLVLSAPAGKLRYEPAIGGTVRHKREVFKRLLFTPPTEAQVAAVLRRPLFGQTWEQDLASASRLAGFDPHLMTNTIAIAFSQGLNPREIAKSLLPAVDGVRTSARRIARTYGVQVARNAQMQAHAQLGDLVIGYQVHSAFSPHSREWHKDRDGTVYLLNPGPGEKGMAQMPNPPLEAEDPSERPPGTPRTAWN